MHTTANHSLKIIIMFVIVLKSSNYLHFANFNYTYGFSIQTIPNNPHIIVIIFRGTVVRLASLDLPFLIINMAEILYINCKIYKPTFTDINHQISGISFLRSIYVPYRISLTKIVTNTAIKIMVQSICTIVILRL